MAEIGSQTFEREIGYGIVEAVYELRTMDENPASVSVSLPS